MSTTEPIRMLGRYELLRRIAKGGMGEIYLARTRGMAGFEKNCIIKTILPHLAEEEEFVTKFLDEGRIVVQLVHGNIVPVFDMGDEAGEVYMAMEYIPGRDLREVTKRLAAQGETMPVDLALFVTSEVCKGLDYAHRKTGEAGESLGIVHRDVSPSNVLISREGEIKLIDFGIARAAGRMGKTVSGRIQGKFCYMSPEQASGQPLDGRSDIFSAGLVLYELLTGFRPFEGDTDLESLDLVRKCEYEPPSLLNADVPEEIDEIVCKALEKDPIDRYQSADKFQIALLQYLYSTGTSPTPTDLADFLGELFPDGLEREELRSARDASGSPAPPKAMSLDEALDFELGKLSGPSSSASTVDVDPHETTAVSSDEMNLLKKASTKTQVPRTPAPTEGGTDSTLAQVTAPPEPTRSRPAAIVAVLVLLAVGAGGVYAFGASQKGKATIDSDPPGAQISVDGLLIPGAVTPHTLKLDEGTHEITLELEGHESRVIAVSVDGGASKTVPTTVLRAEAEDQGPRTFTLHATPENVKAEFLRDGVLLGQPAVTLKPGDLVTVVARAEGCEPVSKQIEYDQGNVGVPFTLACDADDPPDAGNAPQAAATPKSLTIKSDPPGATITVNGKKLGVAPVEWAGSSSEMLKIHAEKGDLETTIRRKASRFRNALTLKLSEKPGPPGCLTMSIMKPFEAVWYIDGKNIGEQRGSTRELASGPHKVRVVNEAVKLDYTTTVKVKPGKECTMLLLDGEKLK